MRRRLLVIYDIATFPFWISLYMRKILFSFFISASLCLWPCLMRRVQSRMLSYSGILSPWLRDKADYGVGLSYHPAKLHRLAGTKNWASEQKCSALHKGLACHVDLHFVQAEFSTVLPQYKLLAAVRIRLRRKFHVAQYCEKCWRNIQKLQHFCENIDKIVRGSKQMSSFS